MYTFYAPFHTAFGGGLFMYNSRKRYANDSISVAIDTTSGEILELVNKANGDNLIKNTPFNLPNMFAVTLDKVRLSVPNLLMVRKEPALKAQIADTKKENGTEIKIIYDKLSDGTTVYDIKVEVTLWMPDDKAEIRLDAQVVNNGGYAIKSFCFPILNSIYLGESYKDDTLVYPYNSGMKFVNPVEFFAKKPKSIFWRWQEYRYCYHIDGCCGVKNADGLYSYSALYSGALSMAWLDLYDEDGGIYFGMHERNGICRLKAETPGPDSPGMIFSFEKIVEGKQNFGMNNIVVALHKGDWHDGADIYRAAHASYAAGRAEPEWFEKSVSLAAHYDFKYQNGGIVHRFKDIPKIVDQAAELNANHILISGWHTDGFDNGFPEYVADKDLGTEEELATGLKYAAEKNVKVSFYINTRIANRKYAHLADFIKDNAVIKADGTPEIEGYGDKSLSFATMCAGSEAWRNRILDAIRYVVGHGATGVYLDQLAMAAPRACHNPDHNHPYDGWCDGYRKLLEEANQIKTNAGEPISIIIEGCSDMYGSLVNGSLVSTFISLHSGAFPELYSYTFPQHRLVDMVYPKRNLAMRPVHVAQRSTDMINKAFLTNMTFWIYDLEEDNSFFLDPEQLDYLRKVIEIKKIWREKFGDFVFGDETGIVEKSEELSAKTYFKGDYGLLAYTSDGKTVCDIQSFIDADIVEYYTIEGNDCINEALDLDRRYIRISYSRCGIILLKKSADNGKDA